MVVVGGQSTKYTPKTSGVNTMGPIPGIIMRLAPSFVEEIKENPHWIPVTTPGNKYVEGKKGGASKPFAYERIKNTRNLMR